MSIRFEQLEDLDHRACPGDIDVILPKEIDGMLRWTHQ